MKPIDLITQYRHIFNTNHTKDPDCVAAWLMDVDEDPLTDYSQNSNTGALKGPGEPNFNSSSPLAPYSGGYYTWDGDDDFVNCGNNANMNMLVGSVVAWVRASPDNAIGQIIARDESHGVSKRDFQFRKDNTDELQFVVFVGGDVYVCTSTGKIPEDGSPTHVAGTYDGETIKTYINGVNDGVNTSPSGNMDNEGGYLTLGARLQQNAVPDVYAEFFEGDIDEAGVFTRALNATEINEIMDKGLRGKGPYPISRLRKDRISGYHCFIGAYMDAVRGEWEPLKQPDGTVF